MTADAISRIDYLENQGMDMDYGYLAMVVGVRPAKEQNPGRLGDDGEADIYDGIKPWHWEKGPVSRGVGL